MMANGLYIPFVRRWAIQHWSFNPADAKYKKTIEHSKNAVITEDSRYVIFKIRPWYKDLREGWIKKKRADEMPKDSLGIVELGKENIWKLANVKSYKTPQKSWGWVAYQMERDKRLRIMKRLSGSDLVLREISNW